MLLMTEPTLFFWNLIASNHQGDDAKETFLGHMDKWITDVAKSGKPKRTPQRITCSSNAASSVRISAFSNVTATSRTSYSSAPKPPPSRSPTPSSVGPEDELPAVLLDDDDTVEREAAHSLMNLHQLPPPSKVRRYVVTLIGKVLDTLLTTIG